MLVYTGIFPVYVMVAGVITGYEKVRVNIGYLESVIKLCMVMWIVMMCNINVWMVMWVIGVMYLVATNGIMVYSTLGYGFMVLVYYISCSVVLNTIDYLSVMEAVICLLYINMFIIVMELFISFDTLVWMFCAWDWLGLISYFCINYWGSRVRSGIKAVIYNKVGDCIFIMFIALYMKYGMIWYVYGSDYLWMSMVLYMIFGYGGMSIGIYVLSISILLVLFTKSAQYPFFSWLLNAMLAPTPISSLLHSSTMVIAGVYMGICIEGILLICINVLYGYVYVYMIGWHLSILYIGCIGMLGLMLII